MEVRIGIVPLPAYLVLLGVIGFFLRDGRFPTEISMMIAVLAVGGFTCGEVGRRIPLLRNLGAAAIFATFLPTCLAYYGLLPAVLVHAVTEFTNGTQFLYLFIAAVIVGSVLGMDRTMLIHGFAKIFVPVSIGSLAAGIVGTAVGTSLGLGFRHTLFYIVVPIMGGGVGEGAIPLAVGYAAIGHSSFGTEIAELLPPVYFGSLAAVLLAGLLNAVGKKFPQLTGEGRLEPRTGDELVASSAEATRPPLDIDHIAAAGMFAITLYLVGTMAQRLAGWPAPLVMLALAFLAKLTNSVPPPLQQGAHVVFRFFATAVTYPLLFAVGIALAPWEKLVAALALPNLITIAATVVTLVSTGFIVGRRMRLYPIETALVNACHSGQGGTGDVAILTAANRIQMMPFAQIATRIGGAITVTLALIALKASL
ncbi:MAG: Malate Na(+) symporter [Verrucomicrobia bacterium]|nr:Malate Na(+) symporter [Verrucomicrobiota bacterium]